MPLTQIMKRFVSYLPKVDGSLQALPLPPPVKLTTLNIVKIGDEPQSNKQKQIYNDQFLLSAFSKFFIISFQPKVISFKRTLFNCWRVGFIKGDDLWAHCIRIRYSGSLSVSFCWNWKYHHCKHLIYAYYGLQNQKMKISLIILCCTIFEYLS